ncbi:MAG TPA: serine/threonine-protein kinase [Kofleriaceae bacterium]|nr:serine/threonine-protein kinase [Kofleriaceae bacterium]
MSSSPRTLGNYVLGPLLGRGGSGEVFAAEPIGGGAPVAIKLLRSHLASDPAAIAAFQAEADRTRAIDHPNVVRVLDAGSDRDGFYLVMERLEGETLAARLARGPLPESAARRIGGAIADALAASHACGIVHRDLKPGNVVLVDDEPRIVDFGIARYIAGEDPAHTQSRIGTPAYMAPEQLTGGLIAPCVDIWALGALLYELVTATAAFDAKAGNCPQLVEPAPRLGGIVSPAYASLVAACLEREPGRRPASAAEVARVLRGEVADRVTEDVGASLAAAGVPAPAAARAPALAAAPSPALAHPAERRGPPLIVVVALVAVAVVLGGAAIMVWKLAHDPSQPPSETSTAPEGTAPAPTTPAPAVVPAPAPTTPAPATATRDIRSTPPGATISIAGTRAGVTPATITTAIPATIVVTRAGYKPASVRAEKAGLVDIGLVPLPRAQVRTSPPANQKHTETKHTAETKRAGETLD